MMIDQLAIFIIPLYTADNYISFRRNKRNTAVLKNKISAKKHFAWQPITAQLESNQTSKKALDDTFLSPKPLTRHTHTHTMKSTSPLSLLLTTLFLLLPGALAQFQFFEQMFNGQQQHHHQHQQQAQNAASDSVWYRQQYDNSASNSLFIAQSFLVV